MNKTDKKFIEKLTDDVEKFKIFIDTCSLLQGSVSIKFFENIIPILKQKNAKLFLPGKCFFEIEKKMKSKKDAELSKKAKEIYEKIKEYSSKGFIDIKYDKSEGEGSFADNTFLSVFTMFRDRHNLLLITQDNDLAKDILKLNDSKSVKTNKKIAVKRINKYGFLSPFDWQFEKFNVAIKVTDVSNEPIKLSFKPKKGDTIFSDFGEVKLKNLISDKGGEGIIFETDTPYVAKIYKTGKLTQRKQNKIVKIIEKNLQYEGICFPCSLLFKDQEKKKFIGFLMPKAKGIEIGRSIFIKPLFLKKFPKWKKADLVQLCLTILDKVKYLHSHNVIMGDINPQNILVISPKEVYFVDADSYQVENYPCPVGTTIFTAPEIQGKHFPDFLRTIGNENFAVATLLFMLMLPGKPPYAQQGGEDPASNIKQMDFPYPCGDKSNKKIPEGSWGYIWSHLPRKLKEAFYSVFMKEENHALEKDRVSVDAWISIFKDYLYELTDPNGNMLKNDKMSADLFPTRLKRQAGHKYLICKNCSKEVDEKFSKSGVCYNCLSSTYLEERCSACGCEFNITWGEKIFYDSKGFDLPKRCSECRENKSTSKPWVQALKPQTSKLNYARNQQSYYEDDYDDNYDDYDDDDEYYEDEDIEKIKLYYRIEMSKYVDEKIKSMHWFNYFKKEKLRDLSVKYKIEMNKCSNVDEIEELVAEFLEKVGKEIIKK